MENRYLIIKPNGDLVDPKIYMDSLECDPEFKVMIQREALGIGVSNDVSEASDYQKYAKKLGFKWEDKVSIGFLQYNYKADLIMRLVKEYSRKLVNELDLPIYEVKGSNFFDLEHPVVRSYAQLFGDRLFIQKNGDESMVMSYDASYPQFNIASNSQLSHKNMPFAHFSVSDCYRYEQSGECMLLYRSRRFFMPDLHPYLRDLEEAFKYYFKIEEKLIEAIAMANRQYWNLIKVSSQKNWDDYKDEIIKIAVNRGVPALVEIKMDNEDRYWIIDVDYSIIDSFSQVREICCIQIDVGNAKRLDIKYVDQNDIEQYPVIIHAAVPGGIERFIYMMLDNYKQSFPLWLHPVQVRIVPVSDKHHDAVDQFVDSCRDIPIRIEIDDRSESVAKRIKMAHEDLVSEVLVFGDKEADDPGQARQKVFNVAREIEDYPFIKLSWPKHLSRQIKQA